MVSDPTAPLHLIVFTRYPEAGKTKTRLMPALGPEGAAVVQRQMTEWVLTQAQQFAQSDRAMELANSVSASSRMEGAAVSTPVSFSASSPSSAIKKSGLTVDVRFAGGSASKMEEWLGPGWTYLDQGDGDLGDRLIRAFQSAFDRGAQAAIAIGIDCPGITAEVLAQAYRQLNSSDCVIGPAADGGYYLIGLRRPLPELFQGIDWGTETVRASTLALAQRLGLTVAQLGILYDVDRPEDLLVWQQVSQQSPSKIPGQISIVIPVLNEANHIQSTIRSIQHGITSQESKRDHYPPLDIIVVDGGSHDDTMAYAQEAGATVISSSPGRALQMNAGAAIATGEYILFLHADTQLPAHFPTYIHQLLSQPNTVAGAFELAIQGSSPGLRLIEFGVKWRSRLGQMPYGDQAIFLKTQLFRELGGFPRLPLMEDFEFIRQIKKRGRVAIANATVTTSGRRWQRLGLLRTTLINQLIIVGHTLGVPIEKLAHWYRQKH